MSKVIMSNKTWIPLTNEELDRQIEVAMLNNSTKEPRQYSLVKFADDSMFRRAVNNGDYPGVSMSDFWSLLYLGSIPNQPGHGVYVNLDNNTFHVIDTEELVEKTEEEL